MMRYVLSQKNEAPMTRSEELRDYARSKRDEASRLQREYPGCRPGWVSCDIEMALHYAGVAEREADQLEGK